MEQRGGYSEPFRPLLKQHHEDSDPSVSTAAAAAVLGMSRYGVAKAVKEGRVAGYGIPGPQRVRWYVLQSALDEAAVAANQQTVATASGADRQSALIEHIVLSDRAGMCRAQSRGKQREALVQMNKAAQHRTAALTLLAGETEPDPRVVVRILLESAAAHENAYALLAEAAELDDAAGDLDHDAVLQLVVPDPSSWLGDRSE